MRIAVCGSTLLDGQRLREAAQSLGSAIGVSEQKHEVLIGEGAQVPYAVARAAKKFGSRIIAYSASCLTEESEMNKRLCDPEEIVNEIEYLPDGIDSLVSLQALVKIRNMRMIERAQAAVIISGSWGTATEAISARGRGIPVGLLEGTDGVADAFSDFAKSIEKTEEPDGLVVMKNARKLVWFLEMLQSSRQQERL